MKDLKLKDLVIKKPPVYYIIYSAIIALGIILDQLTKFLATEFLKPVVEVPIIKDIIHLRYHTNRGMAFGLLENQRWIFITISTIAIVAFMLYLFLGHANGTLYSVGIALVISGGIGNMIDRIALGYVVDFIYFKVINFAIFNGADSFVCIGAGLLILAMIKDIRAEMKTGKKE